MPQKQKTKSKHGQEHIKYFESRNKRISNAFCVFYLAAIIVSAATDTL